MVRHNARELTWLWLEELTSADKLSTIACHCRQLRARHRSLGGLLGVCRTFHQMLQTGMCHQGHPIQNGGMQKKMDVKEKGNRSAGNTYKYIYLFIYTVSYTYIYSIIYIYTHIFDMFCFPRGQSFRRAFIPQQQGLGSVALRRSGGWAQQWMCLSYTRRYIYIQYIAENSNVYVCILYILLICASIQNLHICVNMYVCFHVGRKCSYHKDHHSQLETVSTVNQ